jgi:hypothetical protein
MAEASSAGSAAYQQMELNLKTGLVCCMSVVVKLGMNLMGLNSALPVCSNLFTNDQQQ